MNDSAHVDGGASRIAVSSAVGLHQAGHRVHFFAGIGPVSSELDGIRTECLGNQPYNRRPFREGVLAGLWDKDAREKFLAFTRDLDPKKTIVHFHSSRDGLSASVPNAAIEAGFKVTMTCHEYLLGCPYGGFYDQGKHVRCPEKGGSLGCWTRPCNGGSYAKKLWFNLRFARHQMAGIPGDMKHFVFVSDFSRKILLPYLPKVAVHHIVENPVEIPTKEERLLQEDSPFLFVGHLHPGKDVVRFARAAAEVGVNARFVGEGPEEEAIKNALPSAEVTGWVDRPALENYYRSSRALVFTPIWPETYGMVVYEAAARGLPAIVADDCAPAEWVSQHDAGIVIGKAPGDLEAAIRKLESSDAVRTLGSNAFRAFWSEDRTLAAHVAKIEKVYEAMLA